MEEGKNREKEGGERKRQISKGHTENQAKNRTNATVAFATFSYNSNLMLLQDNEEVKFYGTSTSNLMVPVFLKADLRRLLSPCYICKLSWFIYILLTVLRFKSLYKSANVEYCNRLIMLLERQRNKGGGVGLVKGTMW